MDVEAVIPDVDAATAFFGLSFYYVAAIMERTVYLEMETADVAEIIPAYGSLSYYAAAVDSRHSKS
jgi:hypothetical protein